MSNRKPARHRSPITHAHRLDSLEPRMLLSSTFDNGLLTIIGSANDDNIRIENAEQAGAILVYINDNPAQRHTGVRRVLIEAGDGNDIIDLHPDLDLLPPEPITPPAGLYPGVNWNYPDQTAIRIYGQAGNDTILGTTGDDYLNGGAGDDTIDGRGGADNIHYRENNNDTYASINEQKSQYIENAVRNYRDKFGIQLTTSEVDRWYDENDKAIFAYALFGESVVEHGQYQFRLTIGGGGGTAYFNLSINDTSNAGNLQPSGSVLINGYVQAFYIHNDQAIIVSTAGGYNPTVTTTVFDITDPTQQPQILEQTTIDGDYIDARMHGGQLYLFVVASSYKKFPSPKIIYDPLPPSLKLLEIIGQTPFAELTREPELVTSDAPTATGTGTGTGTSVSTNAVGTTGQLDMWGYPRPTGQYESETEYRARLESMSPEQLLGGTATIDYRNHDEQSHWTPTGGKMIAVFDFNDNTSGIQQTYQHEKLILGWNRTNQQPNTPIPIYITDDAIYLAGSYTYFTFITKIDITNTGLQHAASGIVPIHATHVLDQFSLDEHNGYFRIATSNNFGKPYSNKISIFQQQADELVAVGSIHFGQWEKIDTIMFDGDRAVVRTTPSSSSYNSSQYPVPTTDMLYVFDLTDPANPQIISATEYTDQDLATVLAESQPEPARFDFALFAALFANNNANANSQYQLLEINHTTTLIHDRKDLINPNSLNLGLL